MPRSTVPKPSSRKTDPMSRILFVMQEVGGVGKSTAARALAEAIPDAPIYEIESTQRLIEIGDRVAHFPIRAERQDVLITGGEAALSEYDEVINTLIGETRPAIVDVGANGAEAVLVSFGRMAASFARRGRELGLMVIAASDESAYASAEKLLTLSKPWAKAQFILANDYRGMVDRKRIEAFANGATVTGLPAFNIPKQARPIVEPLGFALVPQIDDEELAKLLPDRKGNPNFVLAASVADILKEFRLEAMRAVQPAAEWVIG